MGLDLTYNHGQTPLEEEEKDGLLIPTIATRGELNEFEQQNIELAIQWTLMRSFKQEKIFTEAFIKNVHKQMFKNVWSWAGEFRNSNKNIGVDRRQVEIELKKLFGDVNYWVINNTYPPDEIAIRFKHRLVSIHCFPNGNGRHSRLMADIIIEKVFDIPHFTWGAANIMLQKDIRKTYLQALRTADRGDINPLLTFARS
jgi:Fic-DOC domain mobile mystery protein B